MLWHTASESSLISAKPHHWKIITSCNWVLTSSWLSRSQMGAFVYSATRIIKFRLKKNFYSDWTAETYCHALWCIIYGLVVMSLGLKDPHVTLISLALACKLWRTGRTQVSFTLDSRWFNCTRTLAFQLCVSSRSNNVIKRNPWQITMSGDAPSDNPLLFMDTH